MATLKSLKLRRNVIPSYTELMGELGNFCCVGVVGLIILIDVAMLLIIITDILGFSLFYFTFTGRGLGVA